MPPKYPEMLFTAERGSLNWHVIFLSCLLMHWLGKKWEQPSIPSPNSNSVFCHQLFLLAERRRKKTKISERAVKKKKETWHFPSLLQYNKAYTFSRNIWSEIFINLRPEEMLSVHPAINHSKWRQQLTLFFFFILLCSVFNKTETSLSLPLDLYQN